MNRLIKIPKWIFLFLFLLFFLSSIFIFFILQFEIEETIKVNLYSKNLGDKDLYIHPNDIDNIQMDSKIKLNLNKKNYEIIVKNITYDEVHKLFKIKFIGDDIFFYPNIKISATLIYKNSKIISFFFS